jgi:hypothetical protein
MADYIDYVAKMESDLWLVKRHSLDSALHAQTSAICAGFMGVIQELQIIQEILEEQNAKGS